MAGTSETLPCGVVRENLRPIDLSAIGTGRTVRWTLNNNNDTIPSQGNDIVLRFDSTAIGGTVRVDLASPEDISLGTDSSRAVGAFGSTV